MPSPVASADDPSKPPASLPPTGSGLRLSREWAALPTEFVYPPALSDLPQKPLTVPTLWPFGVLRRLFVSSPSMDAPLAASRRGKWRWVYGAHWPSTIIETFNADAPDEHASFVKGNRVRSVYRQPMDDAHASDIAGRRVDAVFIKVSRPGYFWEVPKFAVLGTPAAREWEALWYAWLNRVPAPRPLAMAHRRRTTFARSSVLVTEAIEPAESLRQAWLQLRDGGNGSTNYRRRRQLIAGVARTLATAHQAGLNPRDLHAENLLVRLPESMDARTPAMCWLVDLYGADVGRSVSDKQIARGLSELNNWFRHHASETDRWRFLRQYVRHRDLRAQSSPLARNLGLSVRDLACAIQDSVSQQAERTARDRDKRVFGENHYFCRLRLPDGRRAVAFCHAKRAWKHAPDSGRMWTRRQWEVALRPHSELWKPCAEPVRIQIAGQSLTLVPWSPGSPLPEGAAVGAAEDLPPITWREWFRLLVRLCRRPSRSRKHWLAAWKAVHRHRPIVWPLLLLHRRGRRGMIWLARVEGPAASTALDAVSSMPAGS